MAQKTVFIDQNNNELDCYINTEGKVFLSAGLKDDTEMYNGFITLDKDDVKKLIKILQGLEKEM